MEKRALGVAHVTPEMKVLVNVDEAAAMLSIGRTLAWELVRKHKIKSVKIGRTRRVPISAVQAYIKQLLDEDEVA